ncbi:DUF726 domain-containing protein [Halorientalis halophila]|uniref:DUF726 domain-containing protein n=1 Tax=Halorientalis halophila TaxID=3108499 RepID=UPI003008FA6B
MAWLSLDAISMGADAPAEFPMIRDGELCGDFPADPNELLVYVHGWLDGVTGDAAAQANAVAEAVDHAGYDAAVVGFSYPANLPLWNPSKAIATRKGTQLAACVEAFIGEYTNTPVRIVSHSLGARTALSCLDTLAERNEKVRSLSLLGAAEDCDTVAEDGRWYDGVRDGADRVHNYHMRRDDTLSLLYRSAEFGNGALGDDGACGPTPDTYVDHDVGGCVHNHYTYLRESGGCLDQVIADFA